MIWRQLLVVTLVLWLQSDLAGANVCKLDRDKIFKNLSTKTPYAFMLDDITPNEQLNVSLENYQFY